MPLDQIHAGPSMGAPSESVSSAGGKVKQKRRRQRLSCVECTIRRQKCDRQTPCGLCTSRGIPHLCRWEPIVVRPTPQRPPVQVQLNAQASQNSTIETLLGRVAALEAALRVKNEEQNPTNSALRRSIDGGESTSQPSPGSSSHHDAGGDSLNSPRDGFETPEKHDSGPVALIDSDVQAAAVALAQLSLAPRTEYIGLGTVTCALHRLGDPASCRVAYPRTSTMRTREPNEHSIVTPIRCLITQLPPREEVDNLLTIFFATRNAEFGISEFWLRTAAHSMWTHMDRRCSPDCSENGGCPGCREEVNPHWLSLLFAIFSVTPIEDGSQLRAQYFSSALTARRLFEDILLASPAAVSDASLTGSVISCLASVVMATYLSDHGRVSEAWKMIGSSMRCGQALGLHRDARWNKWEQMGKFEIELRTLTWWLLVVADREYSFVLGRPVMSKLGSFETSATTIPIHGDGSPNPHMSYQTQMVGLSDLICDANNKCLGWEMPSYATIQDLDRRYQEWEKQLPARFKWRSDAKNPDDDGPPTSRRLFSYQKLLLSVWWLDTLMVIHRIYLMHPPCIVPPPAVVNPRIYNPSREKCIELAMELTRVILKFYDESSHWPARERVCITFFHYFLFDSSIALAGALSQIPPHPKATECLHLLRRAMEIIDKAAVAAETAYDGEGETAKRSVKVLRALVRAGGWETGEREKGRDAFNEFPRTMQHQRREPSNKTVTPLAPPERSYYTDSQPPTRQYVPSEPGYLSRPQSHGRSSTHSGSLRSSPHSVPDTNIPSPHSLSMPPPPPAYVTPPPLPPTSHYEGMYNGPSSDIGATVPTDFFTSSVPMYNNMGFCAPRTTTQSTVIPYNVLQGVQPASQSMDFDLDWARLVGIDNWYNGGGGGGGTANTSKGGS